MFEDIQKHRQAVRENIEKSLQIGYTESEDFEKAHKVGDVHPNGKWVWTQLPSGKFDWRVIKNKQSQSTATSQQNANKQQKTEDGLTKEELEELRFLESAARKGYKLLQRDANRLRRLQAKERELKEKDSNTVPKSQKTTLKNSVVGAQTLEKVKKVPGGKRINYDDDIVEVYDNKGKKVYAGILDDTPYKDEDYRWNDKDKNYDLPHGYKMVGK